MGPNAAIRPLAEHHQLVEGADGAGAVSDDDNRTAALPHSGDGTDQRHFTGRVEIGIGLIQNDQAWIAVKRPRESQTLPLPGREAPAALPDHRVVAIGHAEHERVNVGLLSGIDDRLGIGRLLEAGNVFSDCAVEKFAFLRQVADRTAEHIRVPLIGRSAVEPDAPAGQRPGADQGACQCRLAGTGRSDDALSVAALQGETDIAHNRLLCALNEGGKSFYRQRTGRLRQFHARPGFWNFREEALEPHPGAAETLKLRPLADRRLDRGERARHDDAGGDHDTGRHLPLERQIGAEPQNRRLKDQAHGAR